MKREIILLIILTLFLTSCSSIVSSYVISRGNIEKDYKVLKNHKTGQHLVFLPMIHIGKREYFDAARKKIDSLRAEGYSFYYENIKMESGLDSSEKNLYEQKVRSILGFNPLLVNNNESLPKSFKKEKYILQDYNLMGLNRNDVKIDMPENIIIDSIEAKYGKLKLSECDKNTAAFEKYECKSDNEKFLFAFTHEFRDPYISNKILNLKEKKIVMIYGKMHWYFLYPDLKKAGYEIVKGKI